MSIQDRLKKVKQNFNKTKGHVGSGGPLPQGTYQFAVREARLIQSSEAPFAKGQLEVQVAATVIVGPYKDRKATISFFLEQKAEERNGKVLPSGLARFKGFLEGAELDWKGANITPVLKQLIGFRFMGGIGSNGRLYYNGPIDVEDESITDEDFDETDDSLVEDDLEDDVDFD